MQSLKGWWQDFIAWNGSGYTTDKYISFLLCAKNVEMQYTNQYCEFILHAYRLRSAAA